MSFSQDVKLELEGVLPNSRHCQLAELYALQMFSGELSESTPQGRKSFTLQKKASMINKNVETNVKNACCKRSFIRGAFLCIGSISDPKKVYDLEFVCGDESKIGIIRGYLDSFGINVRITKRKNAFVLYIKDAEGIVDTLNVMGAHNSLMYMENLRVEKDFRNFINRRNNCECANIIKSTDAANKQISDIRKIEKYMGLDKLPSALKEIAEVRLEHTDSSLSELGTYLNPPVGKSGVNHRLRHLSEIADAIQET